MTWKMALRHRPLPAFCTLGTNPVLQLEILWVGDRRDRSVVFPGPQARMHGCRRTPRHSHGRDGRENGVGDQGDTQRLFPGLWAKGVKCARGWSMGRSGRQAVRICALHSNNSPGRSSSGHQFQSPNGVQLRCVGGHLGDREPVLPLRVLLQVFADVAGVVVPDDGDRPLQAAVEQGQDAREVLLRVAAGLLDRVIPSLRGDLLMACRCLTRGFLFGGSLVWRGRAGGQRVVLAAKLRANLPHLDERQRRLLIGAEVQSLGHGGIRAVARAAGVREDTVSAGVRELDVAEALLGRTSRPGGGRKRVVDRNPAVREALLALVEPDVRGCPMSPLRWTTKSTRKLAEQLTRQGHKISADTVGDLLREEGFSLQSNAKTREGKQHPDRDAQFHYLNEQARDHQDSRVPVISVDTKKMELVGPFKNNGREWEPRGEPVSVDTSDFPDRELGSSGTLVEPHSNSLPSFIGTAESVLRRGQR